MRNNIFFLLVCFCMQFSASAQQIDTTGLKSKFRSYLENNFQEKIYIHHDKDVYVAGEIIWFKIYATEAYTNRPSPLSKVAYVELLNQQNKPVIQAKIELKDGTGAGSLYVPVALESGNYRLRSYTSWMKNFNPDFYFHKKLSIYNTVREEDLPSHVDGNKLSIQFFPEGGNLVAGLASKVAFKVTGAGGQGIDFTGAIVDGSSDTIIRFQPTKFGIGNFYFKPEKSQTYRAVVKSVYGESFSSFLPRIYDRGVVMTVQRDDSFLNIAMQSNLQKNERFTLFVHSGEKVAFVEELQEAQVAEGFKVPLTGLGDGISHVTLFNSENEPLCERLVFKKPSKLLNLNLSSNKAVYLTRDKVIISMQQSNSSRPVSGDFSISVYKADLSDRIDEDILSNLWLTSELKGRVENPIWYFNNPLEHVTDDLMLTHGWRRFNWDDIILGSKQTFDHRPEVQGHIIRGQIIDPGTQRPVLDRVAFLSVPSRKAQLYTASSDSTGQLRFYTKNFHGPAEIVVQIDSRNDSLSRVEIINPFSKNFTDSVETLFKMDPNSDELLQRSVAMQVNNIYHVDFLNQEIPSLSDSTVFYVHPDKVYKLDDYVRFSKMEEVLREYVPEVLVVQKRKEYQLKAFNSTTQKYQESSPFMLLDGVPLFDEGNAIVGFDPMKVQRLELVTDDYVYGNNIFPGIASFYTYKSDLQGFSLPNKALVMDYEGLQNRRKFYSPMYEGDSATYSRMPDYRTTLLWSPNNRTDKDGKATIELFTSGLSGKYYVVVQSLSADGEAGSQIAEFQVVDKTTTSQSMK